MEPCVTDRPPGRRVINMAMVCDEHVNRLWRLKGGRGDAWTMDYIGYTPCDPPTTIEFQSSSEFPEWLKRRVAVLSMLDTDPHHTIVWGVGRRVDTKVYWVVEPGDGHGDDAGDQS